MSDATEHVQDVMDLLGSLSEAAESIKTIETKKVSVIRPRNDLIDPWEPNFVDGVASKNLDGSIVSLNMIEDAFDSCENIHLVGPSGCGKSTIARAILDRKNAATRAANKKIWVSNQKILEAKPDTKAGDLEPYAALPYPLAHYSCHQGSRSEELIGNVTIKIDQEGNRTPVEVDGAVTDAWTNGKTLIFEEFDLAPPGVLGELHLFLDGSTQDTTVYINGPRDIQKSPEFRCIGTSNTRGAGEAAMEFAGTQPLNAAFMNRFNYTIQVGWLPEAEEAKLLIAKTEIHGTNVEKMIRVANKLRKAYDEEQVERPVSTRALLAWAREIKRSVARIGKRAHASMTDREVWTKVAIPSAAPTILNGIADVSSRDAIVEALRIL
jgi:MoxR-like ATPase